VSFANTFHIACIINFKAKKCIEIKMSTLVLNIKLFTTFANYIAMNLKIGMLLKIAFNFIFGKNG
jgi:D-alanyl-lipoteichoic acid acyltransferase DltB (MBOAT superfamily)